MIIVSAIRIFFIVSISCIIKYNAFCQTDSILPIKVSEKVPNFLFGNIINSSLTKAKLSDFKGKLIILDFWDKGCTACIKSFPKMQELQEYFGDKVQILLITQNSLDELRLLLKNSPVMKRNKLPLVIEDTIWHTLFPHSGNPYHVWIDKNGIVRANTRSIVTTKDRIQSFLDGNYHLPNKNELLDFEINKSLLTEGGGRQLKNLIYYSLIMKRINYSHNLTRLRDSITGLDIGRRYGNRDIISLYRLAYNFHPGSDNGKVLVYSKNPTKFYPPKDKYNLEEWYNDNLYCYELYLPLSRMKYQDEIMRQDLDRFFGIHSKIEERELQAIALYVTDSSLVNHLRSKGGMMIINEKTKQDGLVEQNVPFQVLFAKIRDANSQPEDPIFIDKTGFDGNIDITIKSDLRNLHALNDELGQYGLGFREEVIFFKCLILKDIENENLN